MASHDLGLACCVGPPCEARVATAKAINDLPDELVTLIGHHIYSAGLAATSELQSAAPLATCRRLRQLWTPLRWQTVPANGKYDDEHAELLFQPRPILDAVREASLYLGDDPGLNRLRCAVLSQLRNLEVLSIDSDDSVVVGYEVVRLWQRLRTLRSLWIGCDITLDFDAQQTVPPIERVAFYSHRYTRALSTFFLQAGVSHVWLDWRGELANVLPWGTLTKLDLEFRPFALLGEISDAAQTLKSQVIGPDTCRLRSFRLKYTNAAPGRGRPSIFDFLETAPLEELKLELPWENRPFLPSFDCSSLTRLILVQPLHLFTTAPRNSLLRFIKLSPQLTYLNLTDAIFDTDTESWDLLSTVAAASDVHVLEDFPTLFVFLHCLRSTNILRFDLHDRSAERKADFGLYKATARPSIRWIRLGVDEEFKREVWWDTSE